MLVQSYEKGPSRAMTTWVPSLEWQAHTWIVLLFVSLCDSLFLLVLFFFLFLLFGLFTGTWPGHVQTPTIQ